MKWIAEADEEGMLLSRALLPMKVLRNKRETFCLDLMLQKILHQGMQKLKKVEEVVEEEIIAIVTEEAKNN